MSHKQEVWLKRNQILWRVKGAVIISSSSKEVLTDRERELIYIINSARQEIIDNSINSSRELGFNAYKRCPICGRPMKDYEVFCKKCIENE